MVPSTESTAVGGSAVSTLVRPVPSVTKYSVQPVVPNSRSPTAKRPPFDATTSPIPLPRITSPIAIGAT